MYEKKFFEDFLLSLCCNFSLILRQNAENAETA